MRRTYEQYASSPVLWMFLSVGMALPWLLPLHAPPWPTFYNEIMMGATLLPVAACQLLTRRARWRIDWLVGGFAVVAAIPLLQAFGGLLLFPDEAPLISLYLGGFALTLLFSRHAEEEAPGRLIACLFASLALAAFLSTGLALYQAFGLEALGFLASPPADSGRPVANIGQPNNLSTLLIWGVVAIWWGYERQHIRGAVALFSAAFLFVGVALSQSRTGWLGLSVLFAVALFCRPGIKISKRRTAFWVLAMAMWFIFLVAAVKAILPHEATRSFDEQLQAGKRPTIWKIALMGIKAHPLLGYGWNQGVPAHVELSAQFPLTKTMQFAHNIMLDLVLWNGLPLGLIMVGGLSVWAWYQGHGKPKDQHVLLLAALGVFAVHALLELPHGYAFFLLPTAIMMGTLNAYKPLRTRAYIGKFGVGLPLLLNASLLFIAFNDYRRIEDGLMAYRLRAARIGNLTPTHDPNVVLLKALEEGLEASRIEPRRGMSVPELDEMRRTAIRYPAYRQLFRYAEASAINQRPGDARWALKVLCDLSTPSTCQAADTLWRQEAAEGKPEMTAISVPLGKQDALSVQ